MLIVTYLIVPREKKFIGSSQLCLDTEAASLFPWYCQKNGRKNTKGFKSPNQ